MRARSVIALACLLGCGASNESPAHPAASAAAPEPEGTVQVVAEPAKATAPPPVLLPQGTLDERIAAYEKAMRDTKFQDVGVITELGRLQLVRDNRVADADGSDDVMRGKKNAMRAVAVDENSASARLLLALAIVQSFGRVAGVGDASLQATRLRLVELVTAAIPKAEGSTEAASRALIGYLALERGDRVAARSAFESANRLDEKLAAGWAGLGDTLRSNKDYPHALDAYKQAAFLLASNPGIEEGMKAAEKGIALTLPQISRSNAPVDDGRSLASSSDTPVSCAGAVRNGGNDELCLGLDALARANTSKQLEDAANRVIAGFNDVKPLCAQRDPACGDFVASGVYAAARGYRRAGLMAKAIAVSRMVTMNGDLPGGKPFVALSILELGDQYFAIGVFDTAADYYERYAKERGPGADKARDRAAFIRAAFRESGGPSPASSSVACPSPLACGARYLLAEPRWVTGSKP